MTTKDGSLASDSRSTTESPNAPEEITDASALPTLTCLSHTEVPAPCPASAASPFP